MFFVCSSLGELATLIPITGSFATYGARFVDPALGFTLGWNYWLLWVIALPIELLACSEFLSYWLPNVSEYLLMGVTLAVIIVINCCAVKGFGEIEYWLALVFLFLTSRSRSLQSYSLSLFRSMFSVVIDLDSLHMKQLVVHS